MTAPINNPVKEHSQWYEKFIGVAWAQAATLIFTFIFAAGKIIPEPIQPLQLTFLRYLGGILAISMLIALQFNPTQIIKSRNKPFHALRACCGLGALSCILYANQHMPLLSATSIGLTEGIMIIPLAALFLKERSSPFHWLMTLIGGLGAWVVITGGNIQSIDHLFPALIALLGALFLALEFIFIKFLSERDRPLTILFYVNILAGCFSLILALFHWQSLNWNQWFFGLCLGPLAITAQYCNIRAVRHAGPAFLAPFGYSWALHSAILGWLVFGERIEMQTLLGVMLIIGSGIAIAFVEQWRALTLRRQQG